MRHFPCRVVVAALLLGIGAGMPAARAQQTPLVFGPAGTESYRATAQIQFQLGVGRAQTVTLNGSILFKRGDPGDANNNRRRDARVQLLAMDLRGAAPEVGALQLVLRPDKASTGLLEARGARADYPATVAFDAYLMLRTKYGPLVAEQPVGLNGTFPAPGAVNVRLQMAGRAGVLLFFPTPGGPLAVGQISGMSAQTTAAIPNPPPVGGITCFPTQALLDVELYDDHFSTTQERVRFSGMAAIKHGDPLDRDANGVWEIPTEIVALQLVSDEPRIGGRPLVITIDPRPGASAEFASVGRIEPRTAGQNFPAASFFDVFLQVHGPSGLVSRNLEKASLEAVGGIDRFPPAGRPFILPLALDLRDPEGDLVAHTSALTLLFGEPVACPTSMAQIGAGTDSYSAAVATVELELPEYGSAFVRLTGPMTIQREPGGIVNNQPRIGAKITAMDLRGVLFKGTGDELPVQLLVDAAAVPATISAGILFQTRPDSALPATAAFSLVPEVRVGSGGNLRRYRVGSPARLAGIFQAFPGVGPLCPERPDEFTDTITVDLLDDANNRVGSLTWGCLFPR